MASANAGELSRTSGVRVAKWLAVLQEQPRGLYLVAITEFWERFSYWGMLILLVLFLTDAPASGGFGWPAVDAVSLYALYLGALFSAPAIGGFLASRYFGERRCILWGGVAVVVGHLLLAGPVVLPWVVQVVSGYPVLEWLRGCGIALGKIWPDAPIESALRTGQCAAVSEGSHALSIAYRLQAWSFAVGLVWIVVGTGFIKSTVSSIVGKLYEPGDRRREEGFGIFMAFIYMGGFSATLITGSLGEILGWHYGFSAAAFGMLGGLAWYVLRHRSVLGTIGEMPDRAEAHLAPSAAAPEKAIERGRIALALIMSAFVVIYAMAFYQKGGLINLETRLHVDRQLGDFEVPATWLLSVSTLVFIALTLPMARLWRHLAARGREPDAIAKLALGLLVIAGAYAVLLMGLATKPLSAQGEFSLWWILAMYVGFGIADLLVWPAQIAAVNQLAPARYAAFAVGSWYLTIGIGSWLTALFADMGTRLGLDSVGRIILVTSVVAALALFGLRPWLRGLAHGGLENRT